jgi:uncharacterized membrane protein YccC
VIAARNAIGVAAPLVIGVLAGNAALGLPSTIGALQTAFADRPGPYRLRMLRMLVTALATAITSGLAIALSRSNVASALLLLVLGIGAGLLLTAGPSATQVGVAATASAIVLGHQAAPASVAVHVGLLVLAGGVGQCVLAIAAWPLGRHHPERVALAGLYRELAAVARRPSGPDVAPPATESLTPVRQTLYGLGHDHGPSVEAYRVLLDEAERIRQEMIVLAGEAERLRAAGADEPAAAVKAILAGAGEALDEIATTLEDGHPRDRADMAPIRTDIDRQVAIIDASGELTARAAAARVRSLTGQLRAAVETARAGATEGRRGEEPDTYGVSRLRDPLAILRANLAPSSAVARHAARLGLLVSASDLVVRLSGADRGYWVPLTALVVLRPDFASTFQRSSMRVIGTIIGLLLATELVRWVPGGEWYQVALVTVFFFGMRLAGPGNLALSAVALAALVVVLLSLNGVAPHHTVVLRAEDTLIGGALALVAVLFAPLWERELVPARLGELLAAYRNYLAAVADPSSDSGRLQRTRAAGRLARTNAGASVDRARSEPVRGQASVELGEAVLAHSHRFIHGMLTVDAVRASVREAGGLPELAELMRSAAAALSTAEQAVRSGRPPRAGTDLRSVQVRLAEQLTVRPETVGGQEVAAALIDATDRIANSLDTLIAELRRQLGAVDQPAREVA